MTMMASSAANTALQRGLEELLKSTAHESSFEATNLYNISKEEGGEDANLTDSDLYDSQDEDEVESDVDEEAEAAMVQALVTAAFSKTSAASAMADEVLRQAVQQQQEGTQANNNKKREATTSSFSSLATSKRRRISVSAPALVDLVPSTPVSTEAATTTTSSTQETPETCLRAILAAHHLEFQTFAASSLDNFFTAITDEAVARYTLEMVQWVREENVEALQSVQAQGGRLDCRNKFGETLLHAASRRGATRVVQFLVKEAKVPSQVACDRGRTPLHDACWTCQSNFAPLITCLLEACPDLLYVTDQRGLTPLAYVPRQLHGAWCAFLRTCPMEHLTPKQLSLKPI